MLTPATWLLIGLSLAPARPYEGPTAFDIPPPPPSPSRSRPVMPKLPPTPDPAPKEPERTWSVGASVDVGYLFSNNRPDNHIYRGMVPTPRTGAFALNVAAASVEHEITKSEPWRLQLLLHAGAGVDALAEPEPIPGDTDGRYAGAEVFKHVGLANVGVRAKTGTTLEGGVLPSPLGVEWFWPHRNANHTASWTASGTPFYLMGGHIQQELPAGFELFAWVVNGWQTVGDVNNAPSYLAGANWSPRDELLAAAMVYFGPEDVDHSVDAWRVHTDAFVAWDSERLGLAAVWDFGRERVTALPGSPVAVWTGGAVIARGRVLSRPRIAVDVSARPEAWWDRDGRIFGVSQWLLSGTATLGLHLYDKVLVRAEYRYDHSTASNGFFYRTNATSDDAPSLANDQHLIVLALVGHFRHAFARRD